MRYPYEDEEPAATSQRSSPKPISRLPAHLQLNPPQAPRKSPAEAVHSANVAAAAVTAAPGASAREASAGPAGSGTDLGSPAPGGGAQLPQSAVAATDFAAAHKLSDCKSRACSGVLKAFKRALHEEGQVAAGAPASSSAAAAPGALPPAPGAGGAAAPHPPAPASTTIAAAVGTAMGAAACAAESAAAADGAAGGAPAPAGAAGAAAQAAALPCPPDTWELGRATWTFLHAAAAAYPAAPSGRQQALMRGLVEGLAEFYPCELCREHLREQVAASPPRVESGPALNLWLCGLHNEVNEMLGKPLFDCSRIGERWREGPEDGSCD
ncbi:hypothetical protein HXX76_009743 [Chlamydomonas incerta]|uniref:Sulfhydryl oxidase n=1 Tax=Chlamydomonas incerta TaxID=51695 RepID=A0A835VX72_CHLIN|nr:hypothetical protein HXX76_009743 [Chlamydomonas incerta]|eukprot:KAG2431215.1 hypothetical protein HXX76_009743 [Chlamydomonas incerta]